MPNRNALLIPVLSTFALTFAFGGPAGADANSETVTAATHAELAASASDIDSVHAHLHHALNCLVGPGGNGFDSKEINPCAQSGKGAIPDTADAGRKKSLETAAGKLRAGIASADVKAAQAAGSEAASMLKSK